MNYSWELDDTKVMVNVGSVGQPRDNDPRSSYVTVDGTRLKFHRIEYDVDSTSQKIYDIPDLDNFLGDRIRDGR